MAPLTIVFLALGFRVEPQSPVTHPPCSLQTVQGQVLSCCTLSSGQNCCSGSVGSDGTVLGCGCKQ